MSLARALTLKVHQVERTGAKTWFWPPIAPAYLVFLDAFPDVRIKGSRAGSKPVESGPHFIGWEMQHAETGSMVGYLIRVKPSPTDAT